MNKYPRFLNIFLNILYTILSSLVGYGFYNLMTVMPPIFNYSFTIYYAHLLTGSTGILFGYLLVEEAKRRKNK